MDSKLKAQVTDVKFMKQEKWQTFSCRKTKQNKTMRLQRSQVPNIGQLLKQRKKEQNIYKSDALNILKM